MVTTTLNTFGTPEGSYTLHSRANGFGWWVEERVD
jgi:hypothetical protein